MGELVKVTMTQDYVATGAAFFRVARRFSTGGVRSLFFNVGTAMALTKVFSPWSSNLILILSSSQVMTEPRPYFVCSTWAPGANAGLAIVPLPARYRNKLLNLCRGVAISDGCIRRRNPDRGGIIRAFRDLCTKRACHVLRRSDLMFNS